MKINVNEIKLKQKSSKMQKCVCFQNRIQDGLYVN